MSRRVPPHFKAASGIESILLKPNNDGALITKLLKDASEQGEGWEPPAENESGRASYEPSVMFLDTFFSDESDKSILTKICEKEDKFPSIQILLVNPNCNFAQRQPSVRRTGTPPHNKTVEGLVNIIDALAVLGGDTTSTDRNYNENTNNHINRLTGYIQELGKARNLHVRFYDVFPRNPMYFFNDILVCGQFGVKKDCLELPWYKIVDDPICDHDLYDEYRDEFEYIWEDSSDSIQKIESERDADRDKVDIAIICALEEELDAVLQMGNIANDNWIDVVIENNNSIFKRISIETKNNHVLSIITGRKSIIEKGSIASASLTTEVIHRFKPKLILLVGITAGTPSKDHMIGDILVATQVVNYDSGKITKEGYQSDSNSVHLNSNIERIFNNIQIYQPIINRIFEKCKTRYSSELNNLKIRGINIKSGKILCGNNVVSSNDKIEELKTNQRNFIGLEMETYGVYYAAKNTSLYSPDFLSFKSISDFAGDEKSDSGRSIAKFTAAEFCYEFIVNHIDELLSE